jgi:hypothetical protein
MTLRDSRSGGKQKFTVAGINRRVGVSAAEYGKVRGGYQGPDTRGQIGKSMRAAGPNRNQQSRGQIW